MDANQDVYSGKLAQELATDPINMTCLMQRAMGEKVPNSHFSGKGQISTVFGSPGVATGMECATPTGTKLVTTESWVSRLQL